MKESVFALLRIDNADIFEIRRYFQDNVFRHPIVLPHL